MYAIDILHVSLTQHKIIRNKNMLSIGLCILIL